MKEYARNLGVVFILTGLVAAHGCAKQEPLSKVQQSKTPPDAEDNEHTPTPKERALKAQEALFRRLSSELMAAMSNGGPIAAIEVCSRKAPKIAEEVGREHGLSIGRTSFKLRNPENLPPEWAMKLVEQRVKEPRFVELDNQVIGAFLPIHLKTQCLVCHGPKAQMADDVKQQISQQYPDDQATGFEDGELRGWFWVEVPEKIPVIQ